MGLVTMAAVDFTQMGCMRVRLGVFSQPREIPVRAVAVQANAHLCRFVREGARMAVEAVGTLFAVPTIQILGACPGLVVRAHLPDLVARDLDLGPMGSAGKSKPRAFLHRVARPAITWKTRQCVVFPVDHPAEGDGAAFPEWQFAQDSMVSTPSRE